MTEKLRESLNRANPNALADILRYLKFGDLLSGMVQTIRDRDASLADKIVLPNLAKASQIYTAYARSGSGSIGPLTVVTVAPAISQISIDTAGDLIFNAADDYTSVDVCYRPVSGVKEVSLEEYPVVTNQLALPAAALPAVQLCSVVGYDALGVATTLGIATTGSLPGVGLCALNFAKSTIAFNATDGIVRADVVLLVAADPDMGAALEAESTYK